MLSRLIKVRGVSIVLSSFLILGAGCGSAKNKIVDVQGKILFQDGKTLPAGTRLIFSPAHGGTGEHFAVADDNGVFDVEHVNGRSGAEIGKYMVLLAAPEDNPAPFFEIIPKEYYEGGISPSK